VIVDGDRAVLIDWQCPGRGDPVEDLCAFLSPAFQVLYGRAPLAPTEERSFLDTYPDREAVDRLGTLRPFYDHRMLGYCAWRCEALAATRPADAATYARAAEALLA
jgi:aminoglycoside phosphotransferase (APT) family kinase protein